MGISIGGYFYSINGIYLRLKGGLLPRKCCGRLYSNSFFANTFAT